MKKLKEILILGLFVILIPAIPMFIDLLVFGNNVPSNVSNEVWAGFLGSYIGGIATLFAVFITIRDNNRKLESQKQEEKEAALEQRKLFIKPYLDTRHKYFNQNAETEENDRIVEFEGNLVKKVHYNLTPADKHLIGVRQSDAQYVYVQYIIKNLGLGSAIDVNVVINSFPTTMAIAKEEKVSFFLFIDTQKLNETVINIEIDYWDTDHKAHYYQKDCIVIHIDGTHKSLEPREHTYPVEQ